MSKRAVSSLLITRVADEEFDFGRGRDGKDVHDDGLVARQGMLEGWLELSAMALLSLLGWMEQQGGDGSGSDYDDRAGDGVPGGWDAGIPGTLLVELAGVYDGFKPGGGGGQYGR